MKNIRNGVFETNSSSTHTMVIYTDEEYTKLLNEELFLERWGDGFVSKEEYEERIERAYNEYEKYAKEEENEDILSKEEYLVEYGSNDGVPQTLEEWKEDEELHVDETTYITPEGEKLYIICKYGYEG